MKNIIAILLLFTALGLSAGSWAQEAPAPETPAVVTETPAPEALPAEAAPAEATPAMAEAAPAEEAPKLDPGNTAWMLTATALVLFMTIPGVALFYGGMVRKKNVLGTMMQSFAIAALVSVLWMVVG